MLCYDGLHVGEAEPRPALLAIHHHRLSEQSCVIWTQVSAYYAIVSPTMHERVALQLCYHHRHDLARAPPRRRELDAGEGADRVPAAACCGLREVDPCELRVPKLDI